MVFSLALRNIARNKLNNFIIIILIAVICFLFFIGNSVIEKSNISLHNAFIESLTGDVVIQKKGDVTMNLFGANTPVIDPFFTIPVLPAYDAVMEIVRTQKGVRGITSQVSGNAFLDVLGTRDSALLCGADARSYFSMFPGINLQRGRFLQEGEYGAMITADRADRIQRNSGQYIQIGEPLLLTAGGTFGFKIMEIPVVGIFNYMNPGLFMNDIIITDPQTVRVLNSIQVAAYSEVELNENAALLITADINDIFNMDFFDDTHSDEEFSVDFLQTWLTEKTSDSFIDASGGDWNFIIVNLEKNINKKTFINSINKILEPYNVIAVDWRTSAGVSTILLLLIQVLFNAGMFLVCVAGVISAINIFLISVFRRTREIGTLRAIGASDIFVGSLVLNENLILSVIAGIIGIIAGFFFINWINTLNFTIPNELVASLLGGNILNLVFIPQVAFFSFLLAVVLGVIVSVYPIFVTLRIEPVDAVRHG